MKRTLLAVALLDAVYLLVVTSLDPVDAAIGAGFGLATIVGFRRFLRAAPPRPATPRAPAGAPRVALAFVTFGALVVRDIVCGTIQVARVVVGRSPADRAGFVEVPVGDMTPTGVAVAAMADTLSPGSVLVDVDEARGVMLLHLVDATDPEGVRQHHRRLYERYQRHVFP